MISDDALKALNQAHSPPLAVRSATAETTFPTAPSISLECPRVPSIALD